ncbi:TPA_asm: hexon 1 [Monosiga MELD virus 2]|nr:TPA_asm: hexon 1 [Monosiga MELD virus 2]
MSLIHCIAKPDEAPADGIFTAGSSVNFTIKGTELESLILGNIDLQGEFSKNVDHAFIDSKIGMHAIISNIDLQIVNRGHQETLSVYSRAVRSWSDCNLNPDDYFNSDKLAELRGPNDMVSRNLINERAIGDDVTKNANFSLNLWCMLNRAVGSNKLLSFAKTGYINIRIRLSDNLNVLWGLHTAANSTYAVSNLELKYTKMKVVSNDPVVMKSYWHISQDITSGVSNFNLTCPHISTGFSCNFQARDHVNSKDYNYSKTEDLHNLKEVEFSFNDSNRNKITYPLRTRHEILEQYRRSLAELPTNDLDSIKNDCSGIGLNFEEAVDLRSDGLTVSLKHDYVTPMVAHFYFHNEIVL